MEKHYNSERIRQEVPLEPIPGEVRALYLRPGEILAIQERFPVAFQPLGTLEWHGRHNPIGVDSIKAERLCEEAAKEAGGVVMPAIHFAADAYWDCGYGLGHGMDAAAGYPLPGSYYQIPTELLKQYLLNACNNYLQRGFKLVVMVSGHNPPIQQSLMDEIGYIMKSPAGDEPVCFIMDYTLVEEGNSRRNSDHAAGVETSMMLHLQPNRVNMQANDGHARPDLGQLGSFPYHEATAEEGRIRFELQVDGLVKFAQTRLQRLMSE